MEDTAYLSVIVIIALISVITTIIISLKKEIKRVYKYIPSIVILIGSISYCIIITIVHYSRYIGIAYVVTFIITMPAILLSLITAFIFDIVRFLIRKHNN